MGVHYQTQAAVQAQHNEHEVAPREVYYHGWSRSRPIINGSIPNSHDNDSTKSSESSSHDTQEATEIDLKKRHRDNMVRAKVLDKWKNDLEARKKAQYNLHQELKQEIRELKRRCDEIIDRIIDPTLRLSLTVTNGFIDSNFHPADPGCNP